MVTYRFNANKVRRYRLLREGRKEALRRKNKRKRINVILAALVFAFVILGTNVISTAFARTPREYARLTVSSGDTLWTIAQKYNTKNRDIRSVVYDIIRLNDMDGASVRAGETISVPLY